MKNFTLSLELFHALDMRIKLFRETHSDIAVGRIVQSWVEITKGYCEI